METIQRAIPPPPQSCFTPRKAAMSPGYFPHLKIKVVWDPDMRMPRSQEVEIGNF